jgi:uncharacterized protein (DUF1800 family)
MKGLRRAIFGAISRGSAVMAGRFAYAALALCAGAFCQSAQAAIHDHLFRGNFQVVADAPATDAEAARFLTQATFGPTTAEIARVRALGYSQWIDQQLSAPTSVSRPHLEHLLAVFTANQQGFGHSQRLNHWFQTATYGQDQLRQRAAFALSQILVISDQDGTLGGETIQVAEYSDLLARNAFANYLALLREVTYHPSMGKYLSHFRNRKASTDGLRLPDENFAREVMQLFTIGLVERNLDFSPVLAGGVPIPTYTQDDVSNLAKVFTGLNYFNATTISNGTNDYRFMNCIPAEHDLTAKNFLSNTIPATPSQAAGDPSHVICATPLPWEGTRRDVRDVNAALNILFYHPNVAPFIARQMIQRFVTSNPTPDYIQRVATVFENNGLGERGDLGAVVKAVLLDPAARNPPASSNFGKAREPLLRLIAMWRAWDAVQPPASQYGEVRMGMTNPTPTYGQRPLGAPTVFNFWEPDFQPPGALADAGLYAPEFQVIHEGSTFSITNSLYTFSWNSYVGMSSPPVDRPLLDLAYLQSLAADNGAMVELANQRMLYGSMSIAMRTTLVNTLTFMSGVSANEKARTLVYLVALSPEYAVQR